MKINYSILRRGLYTLAFPVVMWLICETICRIIGGTSVFNSIADIRTLVRRFVVSFSISIAMSCNLPAGRFDMSLGAQQYLVVIIASTIGFQFGFGAAALTIWNILFGLILGFVVGTIFSRLRILPMVYGLGMALILECLAYAYNDSGVTFFGQSVTEEINSLPFIVVTSVLIIGAMTLLFNYTSFGYAKRAIEGSQIIAKDAGINILTNCILCYTLAGGLSALAGTFDAAYKGSLVPTLNNGTVTVVTSALLPFMFGKFIGRWSNSMIGIATGALTLQIYIIGLSKLMLSNGIQNLLLYSAFLIFLIVSTNLNKIEYHNRKKQRIASAKQLRRQLELNERSLS